MDNNSILRIHQFPHYLAVAISKDLHLDFSGRPLTQILHRTTFRHNLQVKWEAVYLVLQLLISKTPQQSNPQIILQVSLGVQHHQAFIKLKILLANQLLLSILTNNYKTVTNYLEKHNPITITSIKLKPLVKDYLVNFKIRTLDFDLLLILKFHKAVYLDKAFKSIIIKVLLYNNSRKKAYLELNPNFNLNLSHFLYLEVLMQVLKEAYSINQAFSAKLINITITLRNLSSK